jgi:deoxycytidylate deaminase
MQLHRFIKHAVEEAKRSNYYQKVGAIIFNKKIIISRGYNQSQRSCKHLNPIFQKWPGTIHAEIDAVIKARTDIRNMSILVVRVNRHNQLRLAKPCNWCQMYLEYVGIKKIIYSLSEFPYLTEMKL